MTIQSVFFDLGGTIETITSDDELRLAATAQLRQQLVDWGLDPGLTTEELYQVIKKGILRYRAWNRKSLVELESPKIWQEYIFAGLNLPQDKLAAAAEELSFFIETQFYRRELRPEVPAVLEAIRAMGLKMGIISNVMSRGLVPCILQRYRISDSFDPVVLSSVYGRRKPDPAIFLYAARLAGIPPSACVHIGDKVSRDVLGARRAGYRLVLQIEHLPVDGPDSHDAVPDFVLRNMNQLLDVLEDEMSRLVKEVVTSRPGKRGIRAVLFDAGDLLYHRPYKGERLAAFLAELGLKPFPMPRREREELRTMAMIGEITREEYLEKVLNFHGVHGEEDLAQGRQVLEEEAAGIAFLDGVKETLLTLKKRGFLLGVVTDTYQPTTMKLEWFEEEGIAHVWDTFVSSCEVGVRKPNPRIYRIALDELGIEPKEAAFVGHKASELQGAKAVGMTTVAFNYEEDVEADFYIEHFNELLELLTLSNGGSAE
jgi:HAD superfamily hydrolase (TIGR01509 family)/HAD superfamily hydrolase (TIGR01549 family)